MLTVAPSSPEEGCRPEGRGYIVPEAPNLTVASDARSGRILIAEDQVVYFKQQSHSRDFVSHSNARRQRARAVTFDSWRTPLARSAARPS